MEAFGKMGEIYLVVLRWLNLRNFFTLAQISQKGAKNYPDYYA
jgi:hypothetical protein